MPTLRTAVPIPAVPQVAATATHDAGVRPGTRFPERVGPGGHRIRAGRPAGGPPDDRPFPA